MILLSTHDNMHGIRPTPCSGDDLPHHLSSNNDVNRAFDKLTIIPWKERYYHLHDQINYDLMHTSNVNTDKKLPKCFS